MAGTEFFPQEGQALDRRPERTVLAVEPGLRRAALSEQLPQHHPGPRVGPLSGSQAADTQRQEFDGSPTVAHMTRQPGEFPHARHLRRQQVMDGLR